ncbi:MAG TPA: general secretion pathway protein GspB [Steroidobacteraceae bacterium]|jgi:general secretion pathway protein B
MSFILDALKKSETERQRADAPALYEMKMAPPRRGVATWLIVLAGLLVINIAVLCVVLLRGTHGAAPQSEAGNAGPSTVAPAPAPATTAAPAPTNPTATDPGASSVAGPGLTGNAPNANSAQTTGATPPDALPANPTAGAAGDAASGAPDSAANRQSDDDAPAVDQSRSPAGAGNRDGGVEAPGGTSGELPSYQQAAAVPGANLPELSLDLHAYASNPADRFIFLNMVKLKEGQTSPQGVRVESITPDGAVLSWKGSKFLLQRQ